MRSMLLNLACTVPINNTVSDTINSEGLTLIGVQFPAALTSTSFSIGASYNGVTQKTYTDEIGLSATIPCAVDTYVDLSWLKVRAPYINLIMGSTEVAARTIWLVFGQV